MASKKDRAIRKAQPDSFAAPQKTAHPWRRHAVYVGILWALALIAYANSFHAEITFDNQPAIREDPRVRAATLRNVRAIWSSSYWYDNAGPENYRPLANLSYLFNYAILGNADRTPAYHWFNFLLHAVNTLLVYLLGLVIFRSAIQSLSLAALWTVHPVLTEAVTNIVGRVDMLAVLGVLAGLLCHMQAVSAPDSRRRAKWLAGLAAASALAIFSKENGIVLIAVLLLYDVAFRRTAIRSSLASYAAALLPVAFYLFRRAQVVATLPLNPTIFLNNPLLGLGFWKSRLTAIQVIGRYMWVIFFPRSLSCDYSYNQIPLFRGGFNQWGDWATLLALLACLALAALAIASWRRNPPLFFFLLLFFVALAPIANIAMLIGTIMAERFLYLPALGLAGAFVSWLYPTIDRLHLHGRARSIRPEWIIALLCLVLLPRTWARNADWSNSASLWTSTVETVPASYKPHMNLALVYFHDQSNLDRAVAEGERAVNVLKGLPIEKDEDASPYINLGSYYRMKGDALLQADPAAKSAARDWYQRSLDTLLHGFAVDRHHSGMLLQVNRQAGRHLTMIGMYQLYQELGETYMRLGEPRKALDQLDYASALSQQAELFQMMSEAYTALHDRDNAAISLMGALVLQPEQQRFSSELVDLYGKEPSGCALAKTPAGAALNLACPLVHDHLCEGARRVRDLYLRRELRFDADKIRNTAVQTFGCAMP